MPHRSAQTEHDHNRPPRPHSHGFPATNAARSQVSNWLVRASLSIMSRFEPSEREPELSLLSSDFQTGLRLYESGPGQGNGVFLTPFTRAQTTCYRRSMDWVIMLPWLMPRRRRKRTTANPRPNNKEEVPRPISSK